MGCVVSGIDWPHQLVFVARVGPVGCVMSGIVSWPHLLEFVARVGPV